MKLLTGTLGLCLAAACMTGGCMDKGSPSSPATMPTASAESAAPAIPTKMVPPATAPAMVAKPAIPAIPAGPAMPKAADMTHVLTTDEPYFTSMPEADGKPAGTLKAGSKVLVMVPGMKYSKVTTETGMTGYAGTDGLEPISKK